jgi:hypothetical protein
MSNGYASPNAALLPESALPAIERLVVEVRQPDVLWGVLRGTPDLAELIVDVVHELRAGFGDRAKIVLEPFIDPEQPNAQPRVFVIVVTRLPFQQADAILDRILDGWWADNQSRANYLVSLATEFG